MKEGMLYVKRKDWMKIAKDAYGDKKSWQFKCVSCGHIQSIGSVLDNNPSLKDVLDWIYQNCEGRYTKGHGCDWSLGGLFTMHLIEVVDDDGSRFATFEFADKSVMDALKKKSITIKKFNGDWHGSLWLVEKDMKIVKKPLRNKEKVMVKRGSIVEFRYHNGIHFRTVKGQYLYANEGFFLEHCVYYGQINSDVSWKNRTNTEEILRLRLYDLKIDVTNRCTRCYLKLPKDHPPTQADCKGCREKLS